MDYNQIVSALSADFNWVTALLMVLLIAEEIVANLPSIKSNSLGQMVLGTVKTFLINLLSKK